jgi:putative acetyltransferase
VTTIRPSRPDDAAVILAVVTDAFSDETRDAREELDIVSRTWAVSDAHDLVDLVADDAGAVVGHVLAAPGRLDGRESAVAGVAPVCVAPTRQGLGIGAALVHELIRTAEERGWPLLVLLGDPAYYGQFGFEPAGQRGLSYAPVGAGNPHFRARPLRDDTTALRGVFSYCWE